MNLMITRKGITRRWVKSILLVTAALIVVIVTVLCLLFNSYIKSSVRTRAEEMCSDYSVLNTAKESELSSLAASFVNDFSHKDEMEIQIYGAGKNLLASTSGFLITESKIPDYDMAKQSAEKYAVWSGKNDNGEHIMAGTEILTVGAIRWVISAEKTYRRIIIIDAVMIAAGIAMLIFIATWGLKYINSIVNPIREIGNTTRKIAMGDFDARITITSDDEIGELCDGINYMASELAQTENMKNDFISSVSHELRTPLTAIRGWGETAKNAVENPDKELMDKALTVILKETERLSGLVEELLDFSRIQSGRLSLNMRNFNVSVPFYEAADMYSELASKQDIKLDVTLQENLPPVFGDPDRIKQVFINVIDNAVKYTGHGGQVLISGYLEEGCITVKVSDTGVGIPEKDIDRVKEKFYKANKTVRGSGIGLAVADEIMKQHNGLLFLESREGVGTVVTIVLPIAEEKDNKEIKEEKNEQ